MTLGTIFTTIVAEAAGNTPEAAQNATEMALRMAGTRANFDKEIPEDEAERLLAKLRGELPGIRAWLGEGRRHAVAQVKAKSRLN